MAWPDEIAESLPDPRHDEPGDAQLRRDILDELSDHIDCTASEELRRDGNMTESDVWAAVVKRFGDPRMLAKRLWFDAMKGKIMSNRILMGTNVVLAIAVLSLCVFTMTMMNRNNQVVEALMVRLEALPQSSAGDDELGDWSRIVIQIDDPRAPNEAGGFTVRLNGDPFNPGKTQILSAKSDEQGVASFGPVRPGTYTLSVSGPKNDQCEFKLIAYPGRENKVTIPWQSMGDEAVPVSFEVLLPESIRDDVFFSAFNFQSEQGQVRENGRTWHDVDRVMDILVQADDRVANDTPESWPLEWNDDEFPRVSEQGFSAFGPLALIDPSLEYRLVRAGFWFRMSSAEGSHEDTATYTRISYRELFNIRAPLSNRVQQSSRPRPSRRNSFDPFAVFKTTYRASPGTTAKWIVELPPLEMTPERLEFLKSKGVILGGE